MAFQAVSSSPLLKILYGSLLVLFSRARGTELKFLHFLLMTSTKQVLEVYGSSFCSVCYCSNVLTGVDKSALQAFYGFVSLSVSAACFLFP